MRDTKGSLSARGFGNGQELSTHWKVDPFFRYGASPETAAWAEWPANSIERKVLG
jgi:hypothetical protein